MWLILKQKWTKNFYLCNYLLKDLLCCVYARTRRGILDRPSVARGMVILSDSCSTRYQIIKSSS
jgi:hypothetical protein